MSDKRKGERRFIKWYNDQMVTSNFRRPAKQISSKFPLNKNKVDFLPHKMLYKE